MILTAKELWQEVKLSLG